MTVACAIGCTSAMAEVFAVAYVSFVHSGGIGGDVPRPGPQSAATSVASGPGILPFSRPLCHQGSIQDGTLGPSKLGSASWQIGSAAGSSTFRHKPLHGSDTGRQGSRRGASRVRDAVPSCDGIQKSTPWGDAS